MSDLERVVGVLWEHTQAEGACTCGWVGASFPFSPYALQLHQAEALAAAGLVVTATETRSLDDGHAWSSTDAQGRVSAGARPPTRQQRGVTEWRTL